MIKEIETHIDTYHKYQIPFKDFWDVVKESKVLSKDIFYTTMMQGDNNSLKVYLSLDRMDQYIKQFKLKGTIRSIWSSKSTKDYGTATDNVIEITTQEERIIEPKDEK